MRSSKMEERPGEWHTQTVLGRIVLSGCVALIATAGARADSASPEDRVWSFPISTEARELVDPISTAELAKDEHFVSVLSGIVASDLSPVAKVDAFTLMVERLGWLFAGYAFLNPGQTYFETCGSRAGVWLSYQKYLEAQDLEAGPVLKVADDRLPVETMRGSLALLLASLVDREATGAVIDRWIDEKRTSAVPISAIELHYVALAAALTREEERGCALAPCFRTIQAKKAERTSSVHLASTKARGHGELSWTI